MQIISHQVVCKDCLSFGHPDRKEKCMEIHFHQCQIPPGKLDCWIESMMMGCSCSLLHLLPDPHPQHHFRHCTQHLVVVELHTEDYIVLQPMVENRIILCMQMGCWITEKELSIQVQILLDQKG